jgi:Cu(I)/Ag(I) efflux system membrane fusion protein
VERNIADGSAARMGQTLLTIADLSKVWVDAEVFEADLELMREGMQASITLPYLPGRTYSATVEYVYPYLQGVSRTGRVRLSLDNPEGVLKPDMYAEVALEADLGHRLTVPEEAIIFAGNSRVVFVDLGDGRLNPVRIKTGRRAQGYVEVLEGLSLGDRVVTSGNFLIAAETRLKTGIEQW